MDENNNRKGTARLAIFLIAVCFIGIAASFMLIFKSNPDAISELKNSFAEDTLAVWIFFGSFGFGMLLAAFAVRRIFIDKNKGFSLKLEGMVVDIDVTRTRASLSSHKYPRRIKAKRPVVKIEYMGREYKLTPPFYGGHHKIGERLTVLVNPKDLQYCQIDGEYQDTDRLLKLMYVLFLIFGAVSLVFCIICTLL